MNPNNKIIDDVQKIYQYIDSQTPQTPCKACGRCCDFESFSHKLFITTPELIHFTAKTGPRLKPMLTARCPYNIDQKCTVHTHRFAACRIFTCKADTDTQSQLTESTLNSLKAICKNYDLPYQYTDITFAFK